MAVDNNNTICTNAHDKGIHCCLVSVSAIKPRQPLIVLNSEKLTVGRSLDVDVCLRSNVISRLHAIISKTRDEDNTWSITDNKSLNGVFINSHRIEASKVTNMQDGDIIQFGVTAHKNSEAEFIYKFCQQRKVRVVKRKRDRDSNDSSNKKVFLLPKTVDKAHMRKQIIIDGEECNLDSTNRDCLMDKPLSASCTDSKPHCSKTLISHDSCLSRSPTSTIVGSTKSNIDCTSTIVGSTKSNTDCTSTIVGFTKSNTDCSSTVVVSTKSNTNCTSTIVESTKLASGFTPTIVGPIDPKSKENPTLGLSKRVGKTNITTSRRKMKSRVGHLTQGRGGASDGNVMDMQRLLKEKEDLVKQINNELEKERIKSQKREKEVQEMKLQQDNLLKEITEKKKKDGDKESAEREKLTREKDSVLVMMETEFTCAICSEIFINATTLFCSHSFCDYCITVWCKKKNECPICRAPVTSKTRALVLDNFISQMLDMKPELIATRVKLINERKAKITKDESSTGLMTCQTTMAGGNILTRAATSHPATRAATSHPATRAATSHPVTRAATSHPSTRTATRHALARAEPGTSAAMVHWISDDSDDDDYTHAVDIAHGNHVGSQSNVSLADGTGSGSVVIQSTGRHGPPHYHRRQEYLADVEYGVYDPLASRGYFTDRIAESHHGSDIDEDAHNPDYCSHDDFNEEREHGRGGSNYDSEDLPETDEDRSHHEHGDDPTLIQCVHNGYYDEFDHDYVHDHEHLVSPVYDAEAHIDHHNDDANDEDIDDDDDDDEDNYDNDNTDDNDDYYYDDDSRVTDINADDGYAPNLDTASALNQTETSDTDGNDDGEDDGEDDDGEDDDGEDDGVGDDGRREYLQFLNNLW